MSVLVQQLLTEYKDPSNQVRQTLDTVVSPKLTAAQSYPRAYYHVRTPDVITTRGWLNQGIYISCFCNPAESGWQLPRRQSIQKTAAGAVLNSWRNRYRNTYFDAIPIQFTFQSGNIMPSAPYDPATVGTDAMVASASSEPTVPAGLVNFYQFLELLDQPALGSSQANYHILVYHSRVFPELWLEGWFQPDGVGWTDKGNSIEWTATFLALRTVPQLSNYELMTGLYSDWVKNNALNETVTPAALQIINQNNRMAAAFAEGIQAYKPPVPPPAAQLTKDPVPGVSMLDLLKQTMGPGGKTDPSKVAAVKDGAAVPVGNTPAALYGGKYTGASETGISDRTALMIGGTPPKPVGDNTALMLGGGDTPEF